MSSTNNSISQIVKDFVISQNNAIEILQSLNETVSSEQDVIDVPIKDSDGNTRIYKMLSQSYIKHSIDRLNNTIEKLTGLNSNAYIKLPDGSYKKIITYSLQQSPENIKNLIQPTKFDIDSNIFLENLMSPSLQVSLAIPNQDNNSFIKVNRLIMNNDDEKSKLFFESSLQNMSLIDYDNLLQDLKSNNITFKEDIQVQKIPEAQLRYSGSFNILEVVDVPKITKSPSILNDTGVPKTSISQQPKTDGVQYKNVKRYKFESLEYFDIKNNVTVKLQAGDKIQINNAIFNVTEVNGSTNLVGLKISSGFSIVPILSPDKVKIFSDEISVTSIKVNVNINEYNIIFLKPIDSISNIEAEKWSNGVCFLTNDLLFEGDDTVDLKTYYSLNVMDYGQSLLDSARDGQISAYSGKTPTPPILNTTDFNVVPINNHIYDKTSLDEIKKQAASKVSLKSELKNIDNAISKKREIINSKDFSSPLEEQKEINELNILTDNRVNKNKLYTSIITQLSTLSKNEPGLKTKSKHRIRGFFDIPAPLITNNGQKQYIVQFEIRYKYLNKESETSTVNQFQTTTHENKVISGTFAPWNIVKTVSRQRVFDEKTGIYKWESNNISDAEAVNINQLDIPISKGEIVEISIRSISEAGYPVNPLKSDWSESIKIEFPLTAIEKTQEQQALIDAEREEYHQQFFEEITTMGVPTHVSESVTIGNHYYTHDSTSILSGHYDDAGNQISEYTLINNLLSKIQTLEAKINDQPGILKISIIDLENNTTHEVQNNSLIKLFAGYYDTEVSKLAQSEQKGAIITKNYQLLISNSGGRVLELVSRLPGGIGEDLTKSDGSQTIDMDYNLKRKYDLSPIVQKSIENNETFNGAKIAPDGYSSQQLMSQFIYLRNKDVGLKNDLYLFPEDNYRTYRPIISGTTTDETIWDFSFDEYDVPVGNGKLSNFCLSMDYPKFNKILEKITEAGVNQTNRALVEDILSTPTIGTDICNTSLLRHSYGFNLTNSEDGGNKQLSYKLFTPDDTKFYTYPDKFGFSEIDRYTIGKNTVGSYLVFTPNSIDQLLIDGTDYLGKRELNTGDGQGIRVDFSFQYRMRDYYDEGIAGGYGNQVNDLHFQKRIGLDCYVKNSTVFSFDIMVGAKLKPNTTNERTTNYEQPASSVFADVMNTTSGDIQNIL